MLTRQAVRRSGGRLAVLMTAVLVGGTGLAAATARTGNSPPTALAAVTSAEAAAFPAVQVTTLVSGLNLPWDLSFTPDGTMLFDQRSGMIRARLPGGAIRAVAADMSDLWAAGETGLMGLVVDPHFASNRQFYTCQGHTAGGQHDVRVIKWRVNPAYTAAARVGVPVVTGIGTSTGRHGGCRLRFDRTLLLYVSTGDAAIGTNPQNLASLNGKVLRVTTASSTVSNVPAPGNPFRSSPNGNTRMIYTFGHRNVQGLALRPGTNEMWSVEQGTSRDDEVNKLIAGKNYGYNPVPKKPGDSSYNESVPMTDLTLPNVQAAVYSTGGSTLALSGGTWLSGAAWGTLNGAFLAAALKNMSVRALTITPQGSLAGQSPIPELTNRFGRLRSPQLGPDGALYVTTGDGDGQDQILRVTPIRATGDNACLGARPDPSSPVAAVRTVGGTLAFVVATDRSVRFRSADGPVAYTNLGAHVLYGPAVASWDGQQRLDVFAVGMDHAIRHRWRTGTTWSAWENLGFYTTASPAVMSTGNRLLDLFARGKDGALWVKRFTGHAWTAWSRAGGGLSGAPAALGGSNARVGVRGTNGYLYEMRFGAAGQQLSGFVRTPYGVCSPPGYAGSAALTAVGYRRHDGSVDVRMNGITYPLGGVVTGAVALTPGTSPLGFAAFGRGTNGQLYIYDARQGVVGAGWRSLGGPIL